MRIYKKKESVNSISKYGCSLQHPYPDLSLLFVNKINFISGTISKFVYVYRMNISSKVYLISEKLEKYIKIPLLLLKIRK